MTNTILNFTILILSFSFGVLHAGEKVPEISDLQGNYQVFTSNIVQGAEDFMTLDPLADISAADFPRGIIIVNKKAYSTQSIYDWVITNNHNLDPLRNPVSLQDRDRIIYYKKAYDFAVSENITLSNLDEKKPRLLALLKRLVRNQAKLPDKASLKRLAMYLHYLFDFDDYQSILFGFSSEQAEKWLSGQPVNTAIFRRCSSAPNSPTQSHFVFTYKGVNRHGVSRIFKYLLSHSYGHGGISRYTHGDTGELIPGKAYSSMLAFVGSGQPVLGLSRLLYKYKLQLP